MPWFFSVATASNCGLTIATTFVVWLASERSGALTGRVFSVVGGYVGVCEGWRVGSSVRSDGPLDFDAIDAELPAAIDRAAPNFPVAKSHPYVGLGRA